MEKFIPYVVSCLMYLTLYVVFDLYCFDFNERKQFKRVITNHKIKKSLRNELSFLVNSFTFLWKKCKTEIYDLRFNMVQLKYHKFKISK